jgi:hypothetical protein
MPYRESPGQRQLPKLGKHGQLLSRFNSQYAWYRGNRKAAFVLHWLTLFTDEIARSRSGLLGDEGELYAQSLTFRKLNFAIKGRGTMTNVRKSREESVPTCAAILRCFRQQVKQMHRIGDFQAKLRCQEASRGKPSRDNNL